jgi:hypothetical protein
MSDPTDILDRLMSWSLPPGYDEALASLDAIWAEVVLLCGADKAVNLPEEPRRRREKLIDVVEEYLDRGAFP